MKRGFGRSKHLVDQDHPAMSSGCPSEKDIERGDGSCRTCSIYTYACTVDPVLFHVFIYMHMEHGSCRFNVDQCFQLALKAPSMSFSLSI